MKAGTLLIPQRTELGHLKAICAIIQDADCRKDISYAARNTVELLQQGVLKDIAPIFGDRPETPKYCSSVDAGSKPDELEAVLDLCLHDAALSYTEGLANGLYHGEEQKGINLICELWMRSRQLRVDLANYRNAIEHKQVMADLHESASILRRINRETFVVVEVGAWKGQRGLMLDAIPGTKWTNILVGSTRLALAPEEYRVIQ